MMEAAIQEQVKNCALEMIQTMIVAIFGEILTPMGFPLHLHQVLLVRRQKFYFLNDIAVEKPLVLTEKQGHSLDFLAIASMI